MGRLIIDGNSFFEIDEECLKRKKISKRCGLDKYLHENTSIDKGTKEKTLKKRIKTR